MKVSLDRRPVSIFSSNMNSDDDDIKHHCCVYLFATQHSILGRLLLAKRIIQISDTL